MVPGFRVCPEKIDPGGGTDRPPGGRQTIGGIYKWQSYL